MVNTILLCRRMMMQSLNSSLIQMAKPAAILWSAPSTFHSGSQQKSVVSSDYWKLPCLSASTQIRYTSTVYLTSRLVV